MTTSPDPQRERKVEATLVELAWGQSAPFEMLDMEVRRLKSILRAGASEVYTLGTTRSGEPRHPLMVPYSKERDAWPPAS